MRFLRKVNQRGILTLPSEIREAMGIEEGDILEFEVLGVVRRKSPPQPPTADASAKANPTHS